MQREEADVTKRAEFPMALMIVGVLVGATSMGWWFLIGSVAVVYSSLLAGHLAILAGFTLRRSRRQLMVAFLLTILMWWPALFGDLIWA